MEEREEEAARSMSYRYWVRDVKEDAVPLPEPMKLSGGGEDSDSKSRVPLGSVWNKAGTWEEKSLNKWASQRLRELLMSVAHISNVTKCDGDCFVVTVRNKRRVGYTYELSLKVEAQFEDEAVRAHLDIPEISFGEAQDLQFQVRFDQNFPHQDKSPIIAHFNHLFLNPLRQKLLQFERELKDS